MAMENPLLNNGAEKNAEVLGKVIPFVAKPAPQDNSEPLVFIVEDDKANNFLCKMTLEEVGITNTQSFLRAEYAINDLKQKIETNELFPSLILLDINMPAMDGWGFLNEYRQLSPEFRANTSVLLFSTSDHPRDIEKAKFYPEVLDFVAKPLSEEVANGLKEKYLRFAIPA
jgi:two-component system, chemotaxis family, chemotaxis protein CheY